MEYKKGLIKFSRKQLYDDNDVLAAVNLGEDTDTVGAVAGGLAAIIHGLGNQGEQWLERLRNKELILECLWDDKTLLSR